MAVLRAGGVADGGQVLLAADVDVDIALTRVLADDHAGVDRRCSGRRTACRDPARRTGRSMTASPVSVATSAPTLRVRDIALIRLVAVKHGAHHALAAGIGHKLAAVAEQAAARASVNSRRTRSVPDMLIHHAAAAADLLDDGARVLAGHVGRPSAPSARSLPSISSSGTAPPAWTPGTRSPDGAYSR